MNNGLLALISMFIALWVFNTMDVGTLRRIGESASLRLTGATSAQIVRIVWWEAGITTLIAGVVGSLLSAVNVIPFGIAVTGSLTPYWPVDRFLILLAGAVAVALLASVVSVLIGLRARPIDAVAVPD